MTFKKHGLIIFFALGISSGASGQVVLNALVADSATLKPLPSVTVRLNNSHRGTISNERGYFVMEVSEKDSLTFSIVGYFTKTVSAADIQRAAVIYLTEAPQMLKTVTIDGTIGIPWLPKLPPTSPYKNPTQDQRVLNTPGFQGVQTFGPGYVFSGVFSRHSKEEVEKRKLVRIKKENENAKGYVQLVNDPEVKDKLMKEYNLTEEAYYKVLARFNEQNKEFIYKLEDNELITLIFSFFAENAKK